MSGCRIRAGGFSPPIAGLTPAPMPEGRGFRRRGDGRDRTGAYRAASTALRTAFMSSVGSKRARTRPSRPMRNLVKFHLM